MQLTSIKFLNFRRFKQQEINFNSGFTIIFGKNGAGKSSIIDAIGFCLFGAGIKDFSRGNTIDFKSYFIKDRLPSKVELNFAFAGENYRVVRVIDAGIKKFENDFIIEKNDTLFGPKGLKIVGGKEITDYLTGLFGAEKDIFLKSVFTKQKDLGVLAGKKEDRKKLINSILGIDKIELIIKEFRKEEFSKKTELKIIKQNLENFDKKAILEELKIKKDFKKNLEKNLFGDLKNLDKQKKELEKLEKEYKKLQEKRNSWQEIFNSLEKIKINIKNSGNLIENYKKDLQVLYKKKEDFSSKKNIFEKEKNLQNKLEILNKQKILFEQKQSLEKEEKLILEQIKQTKENTLKLKKDFDEKKFLENEKKIGEIEEKQKEIFKKKSFLESDLKKITLEGKKIKEELEQIKALNNEANCPTCKRPLGDYAPNLLKIIEKDREKKIQDYKKISLEIKDFETLEKNLNENLKKLQNYKKELETKKQDLAILEEKLENFNKNLEDKKQKLISLKDINFDEKKFYDLKKDFEEISLESKKLRIIEGEIKKIDDLEKSVINEEKNLKNFIKQEKKLSGDLEKLDFNKEIFEEIKKKYEDFNKEILQKTEQLQVLKDKINEIDKEIFKLDSSLQENKKMQDSLEKILKDIELLALKQKIFSDYSIYLLNFLKPKIEFLASSYFSTITNNKYAEISLDEEYKIKIDGKNLELYSGGEQDLANLCLRIALGQNLSITNSGNLINFLILDEVLGSQDKSRQENILRALRNLEQKFSQIILISHIDDLKDIGDNLIEVKSIDRLESEVLQK